MPCSSKCQVHSRKDGMCSPRRLLTQWRRMKIGNCFELEYTQTTHSLDKSVLDGRKQHVRWNCTTQFGVDTT